MAAPSDEKKKMVGPYVLGELLGEGAFSKVRKGVHSTDGDVVAVKIVNNSLIQNIKDMERVCREIHVLKNIKHPNIIRLVEAIDKGTHISMVMEFAAGGELYDRVIDSGPLPPSKAKKLFHQILSAVDYCHRQNISHRDLKPENVMLDDNFNAKLADFGLSNDMVPGQLLKTICGSPAYSAPEIVQGKKYDGAAVDVWSCGVILYFIVTARLPFESDNQPELFQKISAAAYSLPENITSDCADLIRQMLTVDPSRRINISQAWHHPWLSSMNSAIRLNDPEEEVNADSIAMEKLSISLPDQLDFMECSPKSTIPEGILSELRYSDGWAKLPVTAVLLGTPTSADAVRRTGSRSRNPPAATADATLSEVGDEKELFLYVKDPATVKTTPTSAEGTPTSTGGSPSSRLVSSLSTSRTGSPRSPSSAGMKKSLLESPTSTSTPAPVSWHCGSITNKDPKVVVKELQRMFGEHKLLLRATGAATVKGDKNKTRFEIVILRVRTLGGVEITEPLYLAMSIKISGEWTDYRQACRRLLWKL